MAKVTMTQRDMVYQLWHKVIGENRDGMGAKVDDMWDDRKSYVRKEDCAATHKAEADAAATRKRSKASVIREVLQWVLMLLLGGGLFWRLFP